MQLQKLAVEDRSFLIQLNEIENEFGNHIPWFNQIKHLKYITNGSQLKPEILETLSLNPTTEITPYILVDGSTKRQEYIGSILNFSSSPERFKDPNNERIRNQLESEKYAYLTCLQIRDVFRSGRVGVELLGKSLEQIFKKFSRVRCVVEDPRLLPYYKYFGAEIVNEALNTDGLYLLVGDEKSFMKRY